MGVREVEKAIGNELPEVDATKDVLSNSYEA